MLRSNGSFAIFVEDMCRLYRRADPMKPEEKKVSGVKEQLFVGLVSDLLGTVSDLVWEANTMEFALQQRVQQSVRARITAVQQVSGRLSVASC